MSNLSIYLRKSLLAVATACLLLLLVAPRVMARPGFHGGSGPLPVGHTLIQVGQLAYFFTEGLFYRKGPKGYVVVPAPPGAVVISLPRAAIMVDIDGQEFYAYAGAYYQRTDAGLMVVAVPVRRVKPEVGSGWQLAVKVDLLNVRLGPGPDHEVVRQVPKGTLLQVEAVNNGWSLVGIGGTTSGWIDNRFAEVVASGAQG